MMTGHISDVHTYHEQASKFLEHQNKTVLMEQQLQLIEFELKKEQYLNMYLQNQNYLKN